MLFNISCILIAIQSMPKAMLLTVDYTTEQLSLHFTWLHQSNHSADFRNTLVSLVWEISFYSILFYFYFLLFFWPYSLHDPSWRTELGPQQSKCQVLITGPPGNSPRDFYFKVHFHTQNGLWLCIFTLSLLHVSRTPCLSHYLHITILRGNINTSFLRSVIPIAFL